MEPLSIGNLTVYPYGLAVALAAGIGFLFMKAQAGKTGLKSGTVSTFSVLALVLCPLLARAGWCLSSFGWFVQQDALFFFRFTRGGFMLYGALIGCVLSAVLAGKATGQSAGRLLDAAAAPAALTVFFCRLAENLVSQGFGRNIYDWFDPWMQQSMVTIEEPVFFFRFPFGMQDHYGEWNWNIACLEAIAALVILMIVLKTKPRKSGAKFLLAVLCYAAFQITLESMRQDSVLRWGFVRVNQLLSAVLVVLAACLCITCISDRRSARKRLIQTLCGEVVLIGIAMAMEFALEQKIDFLTWMRMDVCYAVMTAACLLMVLLCLPLWKTAFPEEQNTRA